MPKTILDWRSEARKGVLKRSTIKRLHTQGRISDAERDELDALLAEYERSQQGLVAAPISVTVPGFQVRTLEVFAEEIRSNRITDGEGVDTAWAYAVGLRDVCGRWPRTKRKVTEGLDPFALRVFRYVYGKLFDDDATEGPRILGLCSYSDLRRVAAQGGHEKRLDDLKGNFEDGTLSNSDVSSAATKGLGIPVTTLGGYKLTNLLKQHYNRKAYLVSSFDALDEYLVGPISRGKLESEDVRKLQKSGKLQQVDSPEVWERQNQEEQRLQRLLGSEYWFLGSETPLKGEEFAAAVANHRCVQEDGTLLPDPLLDLLADRLSGDGVVLTADDLWQYFDGGRPAPGTPLPQRPRSVFHSQKLAEHFAGRLGLPANVVEKYFTRHHDLADKIAASQGTIRRALGLAEDFLADKQKMPLGPDTALASAVGFVSGALVGAVFVGALGLPMDKGESLLPILAFAILGIWVRSRLQRWLGLAGAVVTMALPAGALFWTGYFIGHAKIVALKRSIPAAEVTAKIMRTVPQVWFWVILVVAITVFLTRRGRR